MGHITSSNAGPVKSLLLTTDGSEYSRGTERVAIDMARQHGSHVYALRLLMSSSGTDDALLEAEEIARQMEQLQESCAAHHIPFTPLTRSATDPAKGILEVAAETETELIVVGRRGRRGLARHKVGEATTTILEEAACPVLVVPRLVSIWSNGVLAVTTASESAAPRAAARMAIHAVVPMTCLMVIDEDAEDAAREEANRLLAIQVEEAEKMGLAAAGVLQAGAFDETAMDLARQRSADLLVCDYFDDRSLLEKLFHPSSLIKLIGQAHCPVLVVK
ncbi:MAG: universal stress protein [Magnetococcales bacterium]|nr:universal stress protein [Magnetococcales bacterium]